TGGYASYLQEGNYLQVKVTLDKGGNYNHKFYRKTDTLQVPLKSNDNKASHKH
ncbi:competence protein ComGG, partial [Streptococcus sp. SPC0]|nr:competence protein ComGG [Streptococcus sp. SPC0]